MGDCCSRPKDSEIERHREKQNSENDIVFIEPAVYYTKHELVQKSGVQLSQLLSKLESEKTHFYSKLENSTAGLESTPKISVEVQKGVDLYRPGCFSTYKPYIKISLEPGGPSFSTTTGNKYLPEWYKLIEISQSLLGFQSLRFNIMLTKDSDYPLVFGRFDLALTELENQKVFNNWVKVSNDFGDSELKSRLKVRVQLIHDIRALYTVYVKEINEKIEEVEGFIKKQT